MLRRNFEVEACAGIKQTPEEVTQERVARRLSVDDLDDRPIVASTKHRQTMPCPTPQERRQHDWEQLLRYYRLSRDGQAAPLNLEPQCFPKHSAAPTAGSVRAQDNIGRPGVWTANDGHPVPRSVEGEPPLNIGSALGVQTNEMTGTRQQIVYRISASGIIYLGG